jgi:hypothetical protein
MAKAPGHLRIRLKGVAAGVFGIGRIVLMFRIEGLTGKFSVEFGIGVLIHFNHDQVGSALVPFVPICTVGNGTFYVRHRYHLPHSLCPGEGI